MDVPSQFASRYKKDMSIENLRAKVAHRKSLSQKENRHNEFRKSRGLAMADVNVSIMREQDLTAVEEVNESSLGKGPESRQANQCKTKELILQEERRAKLQRYKEEKQLRKLKEQREKAAKVFKCGTYKPDVSFIPILTTQTAAKVKPKEKISAPSVTRVTRSTAKTEAPAKETRTRAIPVRVQNSEAPGNGTGTKGRGHTSVVKKNEKENKVSAIPSTRTTRSAANAVSKIPSVGKVAAKSTAATKPQKKTTRDISPEMVIEPAVIDQANDIEPEPIHEDTCVESESVPETSSIEHERKPSFAPHNFVFQPLDGLSAFTFQPMTPKRANAFLTPVFTFSPLDGKRNFVVTREHTAEDEETVVSPTEPSPTTTKLEESPKASPQMEEQASHANSAPHASPALTPLPCEPIAEDVTTTQVEQPAHDVPYFRNTLKSESQRLSLFCIDWEKRIDLEIPEDAKDLIRTTVGQTRLLISERFKQFEGLVDNCEFKRGEKETTCTDLDGFWDMIYFQIEDVIKKFGNLAKMEENSWQQNTVQPKKVVRKRIAPVVTGKQNQGDNGRAAARSRLASIKAAMKNRVKADELAAEGEAPVVPMQVDPVVFDAGFFRIESPAKLPGSVRKNQSSSQTNTPKSTKKLVQNSGTPIANGMEEAAEDFKPEESLSPEILPVRKSLFGTPEEISLQNQESDPVTQCPEPPETDSVPAVADLTKYLVPNHAISLATAESPGLLKCFGLVESEAQSDTDAALDTSLSDDVFMCSPKKVIDTTDPSSSLETSEAMPDDPMCPLQPPLISCTDVNPTSDPLDFLGSGPSIMVVHSPMRVEPDAALTDLIVFSPMEN